jgi:hypothetical protein
VQFIGQVLLEDKGVGFKAFKAYLKSLVSFGAIN